MNHLHSHLNDAKSSPPLPLPSFIPTYCMPKINCNLFQEYITWANVFYEFFKHFLLPRYLHQFPVYQIAEDFCHFTSLLYTNDI
jgi:hypothetical protein